MKLPIIPPIYKYIGIGVLTLLLIVAIVAGVRSCKQQEDDENANLVNQGATIERSQSQSETINAVSKAQEAVRNPSPEQLNVVCGKYDRNCPHRP